VAVGEDIGAICDNTHTMDQTSSDELVPGGRFDRQRMRPVPPMIGNAFLVLETKKDLAISEDLHGENAWARRTAKE